MRSMFAWTSVYRLAPAVILAAALAYSPFVRAQAPPGSAQEALRIGSPASVLNDPMVKRWRQLAARRMDRNLDSLTTAVEKAAMELRLEPVFDAVATCRAALGRYPNEPKVIIAHYNASEALSVLALGKFPDSEEQALALALQSIAKEAPGGMVGQMLGFYLGSAYEYGIGTRPDRSAAIKWYAVAAEGGDTISKREFARLQAAKP